MIKKISGICISIIGMLAFAAIPAFAHVIIYPHRAGVAATQDFTVSVPNERDNPVTSVRLLIPDGLSSVVPNTVQGWTITTKSTGSGDSATVTEIDWSGGSLPIGQRAEFVFQAQVPAKPTTLNWKAYQTYSDGTVVSWDVDPATLKNLSDSQQDDLAAKQNKGEYSTTQVINDLTGAGKTMNLSSNNTSVTDLTNKVQMLMVLSGVSIILSFGAVAIAFRKKQ